MPPRYLLLLWTLSLSLAAGWSQEADCKYSWYVPPNGRVYTVRSPNYPSNYRPGSRCYWHLYTDPGYTLSLNCYAVNLERVGGWACVDSISVYGTNGDNNYCMPFYLNSTSNKILMSLQSSYRSRGGTFLCGVQVTRRSCDCGWALRGPTKERNDRKQRSPKMVSDKKRTPQRLEKAGKMMPPTELDIQKPDSIVWIRWWESYRVGSLLDRASGHFQTKVVGGTETGIYEFPSMAALIDAKKGAAVCGATIISQRYVVTAAHCIDALTLAITGVLVGEHNFNTGSETSATRLYRAKRFVVHPGWDRAGLKNDIALVEVEQPMAFSSRVGPVCLPFNRPNVPEVGEQLTVLGWGTTSFGGPVSEVLMKAAQRVIPIERCQQSHSRYNPTPDQQVCTYEKGKDSCQFDSGGPLLSANPEAARYFLASIVSYGGVCAGDDPSVSTRVYNYLGWISTVTGGQEDFCIK